VTRRFGLALALAFFLVPSLADAAALLRLTPIGWSPSAYEAAGYPLDPALIGPDGFRLTYHGGGNDPLSDPVLLILAIPDSTAAPTLTPTLLGGSLAGVTANLGGGPYYGGSWNSTTGSAGFFDSSAGSQSVYQFIGLTDPNGGGADSESFANWNGDTGLAGWNLFVYSLFFTPDFNRGDFVEFATSLLLPDGTFVVGYGLNGAGGVQATPFTFAGRVTVPEPGTLSLVIPALGLLFVRRRKRTR